MIKVRYFFAGSRKKGFNTQWYGLRELARYGITADFKEWSDLGTSPFLSRLLGFRLRHLLLYRFVRGQDVVFGPMLLYLAPLKMLLRPPTKFVLLNIGLTRTLSANKRKPFKHALITRLLGALDSVVCLARFQQRYLEEAYPVLRRKTHFVPLGVDTHFYQPVYEGRKDYVLSVGRDNGRDYGTVIEVARRMPHEEFHLVCSPRNVAGMGPLPPNVHVFYDLSFAELRRKYQEAKLLLLLTYPDGHSDGADCSGQTVLLDALASGLPVVASRKKYLEDYVTDRVEALVVDSMDAEAARVAILSLKKVELREAMARAARARVEQEYTQEHMAAGLADVFTRLAQNRG